MRALPFKPFFLATFIAGSSVGACLSPALAQNNIPVSALSAKLKPYISCINRHSQRMHMSMERYFSWADRKAGPTNAQRASHGLYSIYDPADCAKGVAEMAEAAPRQPDLEKAGADYVKALQTAEPLIKSADQYYTQGDFKDDKLAKGKQMHAGLAAAFDGFSNADKVLRAVVERASDEVQAAEIAAVEKAEGRKARYLTLSLMRSAKVLVNAEKVEDLKKLDVEDVTRKIAEFEAAVQALDDYAAANKQERVSSSLISGARSLLTSTKGVMRRARDKVPYSTGDKMFLGKADTAWMVSDSPGRVIRDYNSLVDTFNRRF